MEMHIIMLRIHRAGIDCNFVGFLHMWGWRGMSTEFKGGWNHECSLSWGQINNKKGSERRCKESGIARDTITAYRNQLK